MEKQCNECGWFTFKLVGLVLIMTVSGFGAFGSHHNQNYGWSIGLSVVSVLSFVLIIFITWRSAKRS